MDRFARSHKILCARLASSILAAVYWPTRLPAEGGISADHEQRHLVAKGTRGDRRECECERTETAGRSADSQAQ